MPFRPFRRSFVATALFVSLAGCAGFAPAPLVHLEVHGEPSQNGKVLDMSFDELERDATSSLVQVDFRSGGSVSSSFFEMRGMCAVARAHRAAYFSMERVGTRPSRYRVTFPVRATSDNALPVDAAPAANPSSAVVPAALCLLLG